MRVELPWEARFGKLVAEAHRAIYRAESDLDANVRNAAHSLLQIGSGDDEDFLQLIEDVLKGGSRAIPYHKDYGEHSFLTPSAEMAVTAAEHLETKEESLYRVAYSTLE